MLLNCCLCIDSGWWIEWSIIWQCGTNWCLWTFKSCFNGSNSAKAETTVCHDYTV